MKTHGRFLSLAAAVLAAVLLVGAIAPAEVSAASQKSSGAIRQEINELKGKRSEIQKKIKELEGKISDNLGEMEKIVAQKQVLEQEIALRHDEILTINEQLRKYGLLIADKQAELEEAEKKLQELNAHNKERIRIMEEEGSLSYWSVLFKSSSFSDFLDRVTMVQEIADADHRRLDEIHKASEAVIAAKNELESEKTAMEESRAELDEAQKQLEADMAQQDELLQALLVAGAEYQALLDTQEEGSEELTNELVKLDAEYRKAKDREYKAWLATQKPVTPPANHGGSSGTPSNVNGIRWLVPINYTKISSPFGMRIHPIYHRMKMHSGVDLSAPRGTPIIASRSGVVTVAAYERGGAGNYVNVNHMDGFSTRYMHMTHYVVSPGQKVVAGQLLGYCGSTGAATGPHLHFSVYLNGTPVNPANYIAI